MREEAFDASLKMMATFHEANGRFRVAVKGAPEAVLDACRAFRTSEGEQSLDDATRQSWLERNAHMADGGLRVLAVATKIVEDPECNGSFIYSGKRFNQFANLMINLVLNQKNSPLTQGWQFAMAGEQLLNFIHGQASLDVANQRLRLNLKVT